MAHLSPANSAAHSIPLSSSNGYFEPLFITEVVMNGKCYLVEAIVKDAQGNILPIQRAHSTTAQHQLKGYTKDLFEAHLLRQRQLNQGHLEFKEAHAQGMICKDGRVQSHDFHIEPLNAAMANRIASELPPHSASSIKAQDLWNKISSTILSEQTSFSTPTDPSLQLENSSSTSSSSNPYPSSTPNSDPFADVSTPQRNLQNDPFADVSTPSRPIFDDPFIGNDDLMNQNPLHTAASANHLDPDSPHNDPNSRGQATPVLSLSDPPSSTPASPSPSNAPIPQEPPSPAETDTSQQIQIPLPKRQVLSTELQLTKQNFNFSSANWYENIPARTRLRICKNILNCKSFYPIERRVWDLFNDERQKRIASSQSRVPTITQMLEAEVQKLQSSCQSLPSSITAQNRKKGEQLLKNIENHQFRRFNALSKEELNRQIRSYPVTDPFFLYYLEQIQAEGIILSETIEEAQVEWARAHYADDISLFARVLERFLDAS